MTESEKEPRSKSCFVICPIDKPNTPIRKWSDDVLDCIITPVVTEAGYAPPIRADRVNESGVITRQIVDHLIDSDLVIADLSYRNPNVFYELAVRHMTKKPCIHMIRYGENNPFDTAGNRAIDFEIDIRNALKAKEDLKNHITSIQRGKYETDNPISSALTLKNLEKSGQTEQYSLGQVLEELRDLRNEIKDRKATSSRIYSPFRNYLDNTIESALPTISESSISLNNDEQYSRITGTSIKFDPIAGYTTTSVKRNKTK